MPLHLRESTDLLAAARDLRQRAENGRGLTNAAPQVTLEERIHGYLNWVEAAEGPLRNTFTDPGTTGHMRGGALLEIISAPGHLVPRLIYTEALAQVAWLESQADRLVALHERLTSAPGAIVVVDANVLLQYQRPSQINWPAVIGVDEVRLVLPLRVIEELDEKKWLARADLAARARGILSGLWELLEPTAGAPVPLRDNVTVEVPIDDGPRARVLDADHEVLELCEEMRNAGQLVRLATADNGISLRAVARRFIVVVMPDSYRRKRPEPDSPDAEEEAAGV